MSVSQTYLSLSYLCHRSMGFLKSYSAKETQEITGQRFKNIEWKRSCNAYSHLKILELDQNRSISVSYEILIFMFLVLEFFSPKDFPRLKQTINKIQDLLQVRIQFIQKYVSLKFSNRFFYNSLAFWNYISVSAKKYHSLSCFRSYLRNRHLCINRYFFLH